MATPLFAQQKGKTASKFTKRQYLEAAPDTIEVKIGDQVLSARCKVFSSTGVGFGYNDKKIMKVASGMGLVAYVNGQSLGTEVFRALSGSKGWSFNTKTQIKIGDHMVDHQVGINVSANDSKNWASPVEEKEVKCTISVNLTAVKSKEWEQGGDISGWMKPAKVEANGKDEDDEEEAPVKKPEQPKSNKPRTKPRQLAK